MSDIEELVELPDVAIQALVHPVDLEATRSDYRSGWLVGVLSAPAVGLVVGLVAWRLGAGFVMPIIAGGSLVALGAWVRAARIDDAWAHIPRRRQDRGRVLPRAWELADGTLTGAALMVAALLAADGLRRADVPSEVHQFIVGAAAALVVLVALDLAASVALRRGTFVARPLYALPIVVGLALAVIVGAGVLASGGMPLLASNTGLGAGMMLAVGAAVGLWAVVRPRPSRDARV